MPTDKHTIAISGLSRVRTELAPLLVIPAMTPHPVQTNRQPAGHRHLGGLASARTVEDYEASRGWISVCSTRAKWRSLRVHVEVRSKTV